MPNLSQHLPFVFAFAAAIAVIADARAFAAPPCDCKHLKALQLALKNARTLQTRFQQEAPELRKLDQGSSQDAFERFTKTRAGQGIQAPPGDEGPTSVLYTPAGLDVYVDAIGRHTNKELCEFSKSTSADLAKVEAGSICSGMADAARTHEEYHRSQCEASGLLAYLSMHGADRAMEEANAYNATALKLREVIRRVLENAQVDVYVDTKVHTDGPRNPAYTGSEIETNGRIQTTNTSSNPVELRFEGNGTYRFSFVLLGGNCQAIGVPASIQANATVTADGETAKVSFQPTGTVPQFGGRCVIPGHGRSSGMSIPGPADPSGLAHKEFLMPFEDGAKIRTDMAKTQAAQIMSGAGVRMSGYTEIGIHLVCYPPK